MNAPTFQTRRGAAAYAASVAVMLTAHRGVRFDRIEVVTTADDLHKPVIEIATSPTPEEDAHGSTDAAWTMLAANICARVCLGLSAEDSRGQLGPHRDIEFWAATDRNSDPVAFIRDAYVHGEQTFDEFCEALIYLASWLEFKGVLTQDEIDPQLNEEFCE